MYLLICTCGSVVCHIGASCLPYLGHTWARQRSHVGHTWATVAKKRVAHMCALGGSHFNCNMWALCGPLVECLLGGGQYACLHQHNFWIPTRNVLGHILFLININELPGYIQNNTTLKLFTRRHNSILK